jgi:hypothetical protein
MNLLGAMCWLLRDTTEGTIIAAEFQPLLLQHGAIGTLRDCCITVYLAAPPTWGIRIPLKHSLCGLK